MYNLTIVTIFIVELLYCCKILEYRLQRCPENLRLVKSFYVNGKSVPSLCKGKTSVVGRAVE